MTGTRYQEDYYLWTREQAAKLRDAGRSGNNAPIDWEQVAEEIEDMGDEKWDEIETRLGLLVTHLLKLIYCEELRERNARYWLLTIREQRRSIPKRLKRSPSLRPLLREEFATVYEDARDDAAVEAEVDISRFPIAPPFTLEQVMDPSYPADLIPDSYRPQR
ncbi:MAG: hypothetical protein RLY86_784 [Pseudomonadota bacterium]|jgi:hypothetical protein